MAELNSSIMCFPEELHIEVLHKLDGHSIALCKRVCKYWQNLISRLEERKIWLEICLTEIPQYIFQELTGLTIEKEELFVELGTRNSLPWEFWREIYAEYWRFSYINNGVEQRTELYFPSDHGEVSCLYIYNPDDVIYSGHESGHVISWCNTEEDKKYHVMYKHYKRVTSIAGVDMVMSIDDIKNGYYGNKVVSTSQDSNLMLFNLKTKKSKKIRHYNKQVNCVSSWGNHFVAAADRSSVQGHPVWKSFDLDDVDLSVTCTLSTESSPDVTAVAFWDNVVLSGDEIGDLYIWSDNLDVKKKRPQIMAKIASLGCCIKSIFMLGRRIVCYTADGQLHISGHQEAFEFQKFDVYQKLRKSPECIAIRGSILAIGCRSGTVYLYFVETDEDWDILDLSKPSRVIQMSHDHIHSIVIGGNIAGPYVAIATNNFCLTIVQYHRKPKYKLKQCCDISENTT